MLRVFSVYMILATTITLIHIYLEYTETYQSLRNELATVAKSMEPGLVTALWDINFNQTYSVFKGAMEIPEVTGLLLYDESKNLVGALGVVTKEDGKTYRFNSLENFTEVTLNNRLIPHVNGLFVDYGGNQNQVGHMIIFSDTSVVFGRVKVDVLYILVGAILKSFGLWMIFLYFAERFLAKPLRIFIKSIEGVDIKSNESHHVNIGVKRDNELSKLELTFNQLVDNLHLSGQEKQNAFNKLHYSESLLSNLIDILPVGVLLTDIEGKCLIYNQQWSEITGQTALQLNQTGPFHVIHPKDLARIMMAWQDSLISGEMFCQEYRILREGKGVEWVLAQACRQRNFANDENVAEFKFKGVFWTITLITELKNFENQVLDLNKNLESRVDSRTIDLKNTNQELSNTLNSLKEAQGQLIESEKMAALGELVSGIAHEVNTPIGVVLTASTYFEEQVEKLEKQFKDQSLTKGQVEAFLKTSKDAGDIIHQNIRRASELISSFKMVAVDQHSDESRLFNIKNYVNEILLSLTPMLKNRKVNINVRCPNDLEVDNCPGVFYQMISNLVINSLIHGFDEEDEGDIELVVSKNNQLLFIDYKDTGKGMKKEVLDKLFNPFFTTRRGTGGSGLGAYIIYNLVTHRLDGTIHCASQVGEGVHYHIEVPTH